MGNKLVCEDCTFYFTIHSPMGGRKPSCPMCGESMYVQTAGDVPSTHVPLEPEWGFKRRWRPNELETVERVINGELTPHQAAGILGRTMDGVRKKVQQMRRAVIDAKHSTVPTRD